VNDATPLQEDGAVIVYLQYLKSFSPSPSYLTTLFKTFLSFWKSRKENGAQEIREIGENRKELIV
jgi:hypothetical protein